MTDRRWPLLFSVILVLAGATWLTLGAGMTFFSDEWAFIENRSLGNLVSWFLPHNEHWSTLPVMLYRVLVETVGIGSYVPYQAAVILLHLAVAALVFRIVGRRSGPGWGFVAGTLVAFFGSGFENLFWGFQTGFVGSMAFGLLAIDVSDRGPSLRRAWAVAFLLVLSLMSSGIGIATCAVVGVTWLLHREWRRYVGILAIPATAYAAWLAAFGRTGVATLRSPFTVEAVADAPRYVVGGFADAASSITGLGSWLGVGTAVVIVAFAGAQVVRGRLAPLAGGALVAITLQYAAVGLVRGGLFEGQVHYSRYVYVSGILLILAVSSLVGLPRRPATDRWRRVTALAASLLIALAFAYNGLLIMGGRALFLDRADMTRALVTAGLRRPLPPETDPARTLVLVPSPIALDRLLVHGDPRGDSVVPFAVRPIPPAIEAEAERRVREGASVPQPEAN